jgi:hypothetical protein
VDQNFDVHVHEELENMWTDFYDLDTALRTLKSEEPARYQEIWERVFALACSIMNLSRDIFTVSKEAEWYHLWSIMNGARRGGSKSGETRKNKRASIWVPEARALAKAFRTEIASASQDAQASEIQYSWKDAKPPSHQTLKRLVSRMEKAGEIPARIRSRRPFR